MSGFYHEILVRLGQEMSLSCSFGYIDDKSRNNGNPDFGE